MVAVFACKKCGHKIDVSFSKDDKFYDTNIRGLYNSCINCGAKFSNTNYIVDFADKFLSLQRGLPDLKLCKLIGDLRDV